MRKRVGYAAKGTGLPILGQPTTYYQVTPPPHWQQLTVHAIRQEETEHRSSRDSDPTGDQVEGGAKVAARDRRLPCFNPPRCACRSDDPPRWGLEAAVGHGGRLHQDLSRFFLFRVSAWLRLRF
jgi:hypothetical protein